MRLKALEEDRELLSRLKKKLKSLRDAVGQREKQRMETEVLNDYNYVRARTRKRAE